MQAIILAGGKGTRLKPFTNSIPKPLVPLGEQSILEIILKQLKYYGIEEVTIAVNHLAHLIMAFFGDGKDLGLRINYSMEDQVLGTAGPLKLVKNLRDQFLVLNGDLLTTIDYADLLAFHRKNHADISIGTFSKKLKIDLGVVKSKGNDFIDYEEKPTLEYLVSMGVYSLNNAIIDLIPTGKKFDMPELVKLAHSTGKIVKCYKGNYDWLDIGRIEDYEAAIEIFESDINKYIPY